MTAIPIKRAPVTFLTKRTAVTTSPIITSITLGSKMLPKETKVAAFLTEIPAFCRPIKAIKRPIPTPMAVCKLAGIE